jgi:hypothetical protein
MAATTGGGDDVSQAEEWVLLAYRLPRLPSTPRSAVWRKLRRLGVAQLGDGLVALPGDARTREQLEWIAEEVTEHGGRAMVWLGHPLDPGVRSAIVTRMTAPIAAEYCAGSRGAISSPHASVSWPVPLSSGWQPGSTVSASTPAGTS